MKPHIFVPCWAAAFGAAVFLMPVAHAAEPADLLTGYSAQAGRPASADQGRALFTSRHGREWSCASCHGAPPTQAGQARFHRQGDRRAGAGFQRRALHRCREDREMVPPQLQRRDGPRMHRRREGRRAGLAAEPEALRSRPCISVSEPLAILAFAGATCGRRTTDAICAPPSCPCTHRNARPATSPTRPACCPRRRGAVSWAACPATTAPTPRSIPPRKRSSPPGSPRTPAATAACATNPRKTASPGRRGSCASTTKCRHAPGNCPS